MELHDYLARIEQTVRDNLLGDCRIVGLIESKHLSVEREGYWEKVYHVAWVSERKAGTHQANVNSNGENALFFGHYIEEPNIEAAMIDLFDRASPLNKTGE